MDFDSDNNILKSKSCQKIILQKIIIILISNSKYNGTPYYAHHAML